MVYSGNNGLYGSSAVNFTEVEELLTAFIDSYAQKSDQVGDEVWLQNMLMHHLPGLPENEAGRMAAEITALASMPDDLRQELQEAAERYGCSAEMWLYRMIIAHCDDDDEEDFKSELADCDAVFKAANVCLMQHLTEAKKDKHLIDNVTVSTGFKKSLLSQYQRSLRLDLAHMDTTEAAHSISRNVALSGVGGIAVSAGLIALAGIGGGKKTGDGRRQMMLSMLKAGTDTGLRTAVAGALKVGAERNILPLISRTTPAMALIAVATIGIESAKIVNEYARGNLSGLEAMDRAGRTSVTCVAMLWFTAKGVAAGVALGTVTVAALPVVGALMGGVIGTVGINIVGSVVGGTVGSVVGKTVGEVGYDSVKQIAYGMADAFTSLYRGEEIDEENVLRQTAVQTRGKIYSLLGADTL